MRRIGVRLFLAGAAIALSAAALAQDADPLPWWWGYPFKAFSMPSESMVPTIQPVSYLIAHKRPASELRRGDLVAFRRKGDEIWVMRVAALPGDRVAMIDGEVVLNGHIASYGKAEPYPGELGPSGRPAEAALQRTERFEGEAASHQILDLGRRYLDNRAETIVAKDHVHVLGDNRDNAADSRTSADDVFGLGQVAFADVYGVIDTNSIKWMKTPERARRSSGQPTVIVPTRDGQPQ